MTTSTQSMPTTSDGAWWADLPDASLQQYVSQLDSGKFWAASAGTTTLTYNVMNQASSIYDPNEAVGFTPFNSVQQAAVGTALQAWSDVANIQFVATSSPADINLGASSTTTGGGTYTRAWTSGGFTTLARADVWLSSSWITNQQMAAGQYGLTTLIHELGHAVGLDHAGNYDVIGGQSIEAGRLFGNDDRQHSIMSYFQSPAYQNQNLYPSSPMVMDIAAIQSLYGANMTTRTGNDTYSWPDKAGFISAIWDAGGTDTIDASDQTLRSIIDLNPGAFSSIGSKPDGTPALNNLAIAYGVTIENAIGGRGDDTLLGNRADNVLTGGAGNNLFDGRDGNNTLIGGTGNNTYVFEGDWGQDTVIDASGRNVLTFQDIGRSQLQFSQSGDNLIIQENGSSKQVTVNGYYVTGRASSYTMADSAGTFTFALVAAAAKNSVVAGAVRLATVGATPVVASSPSGGNLLTPITLAGNNSIVGASNTDTMGATPVVIKNAVDQGAINDNLTLTALAGERTMAGTDNLDINSALVTVKDGVASNHFDHYKFTATTDQMITARPYGMTANSDLYLHSSSGHSVTLSAHTSNNPAQMQHNLAPDHCYVGGEGYAGQTNYSLSLSADHHYRAAVSGGFYKSLASLAYHDNTGLGFPSLTMVEDSNMPGLRQLGMLVVNKR
ncbi:MAG: M10 family metallopeptidase C-terminal domain-containing protein [Magnetococcales bacterium]|nr:M10 family metallopeptidase C-terminal domain-containing protein [Magnetococcales bacterium]